MTLEVSTEILNSTETYWSHAFDFSSGMEHITGHEGCAFVRGSRCDGWSSLCNRYVSNSTLSVILFTGRRCVYVSMHWDRHPQGRHIPACTGADTPLGKHIPACTGADTPPPGIDTPQADTPQAVGYCCGRYASYWNAFLFEYDYHIEFRKNPPGSDIAFAFV